MSTERSDADFPTGPLSDIDVRDLARLMDDLTKCGATVSTSAYGTQILLPNEAPEITRQRLDYFRHDARQLVAAAMTEMTELTHGGGGWVPFSALERAVNLAQLRVLTLIMPHIAYARTLPHGFQSTWARDHAIANVCALLYEADQATG